MINRIYIVTIIFITAIIVSGCSNMIYTNHQAVKNLLVKTKLDKDSKVVIATIVNINNLESSSALGRTISEQLTTKFVDADMQVVEMKLRKSIYVKRATGELILSRKISKLAKAVNADAIVAGTYSNAKDSVYINLRIIDPETQRILSTVDYVLNKDKDIKKLLGEKDSRW